MNKIVYGGRIFTDHEIESGNLHLATNLIFAQLESNTFTVVVRSSDTTLTNFERNAKLILYIDDKQSGIFYVQSIDRIAAEKYKIFATSAVGLLIEGNHMGGIYTGQTAQEIISDICGNVPFIVKSNLVDTKLYGWLPIASPRDNLSQVLFAIGATLKTDMDGVMRIEELWDAVSGDVTAENMYQGARSEYNAKVTSVIVTEHQYIQGEEEKQLFDGLAHDGDIIAFQEPMHSLTATGITILDSGANWAKVSYGIGTVSGKTYIHNTRKIEISASTSNLPNVKKVDNATLLSQANSVATAYSLSEYFKCYETISAPVLYRGENTGDCLKSYHPFDRDMVRTCLESQDITISNTIKSHFKCLVGYYPRKFEYQDNVDVITENSYWVVPNDVHVIRIVLIGGGQGGWSGKRGGSVSEPDLIEYEGYDDAYGVWSDVAEMKGRTYGGFGGDVGEGGEGGKVFISQLLVSPGEQLKIKIGRGGNGGIPDDTDNSNEGDRGEDTTVTTKTETLSSALGVIQAEGFLDYMTGETYAAHGEKGLYEGGRGSGSEKGNSIIANGVTWNPGVSYDNRIVDSGSYRTATAYGGKGGGAAYGSSGHDGYQAIKGYNTPNEHGFAFISEKDGYVFSPNAMGASGGDGANALPPAKQDKFGYGGIGGNGGGGAGSYGSAKTTRKVNTTVSLNTEKPFLNAKPGLGSKGGDGGDGAVLIYYSDAQKKNMPCRFVDRNGKNFLDRLSRRVIA